MIRLLGAVAALSMLTGALSAPVLAADDLLQKVKSRSVLRACVVDYPPVLQKDPKSPVWDGMYVKLAELLVKGMGVKIEYVD